MQLKAINISPLAFISYNGTNPHLASTVTTSIQYSVLIVISYVS